MKSNLKESEKDTKFPISQTKIIAGSRRLVREKVLQILVAYFASNTETSLLFKHIFYRDFTVEDSDPSYTDSTNNSSANTPLLTDEEILNMNADSQIDWHTDNVNFGKKLITTVIENYDMIVNSITEVSENWNFDRISIIDRAIICISAAEFISFPDIPIKATINEAIELAKIYSTDKSYIFINGIVEKLKIIFTEKQLIEKSERGKQ